MSKFNESVLGLTTPPGTKIRRIDDDFGDCLKGNTYILKNTFINPRGDLGIHILESTWSYDGIKFDLVKNDE